jgi:hypothetical protein
MDAPSVSTVEFTNSETLESWLQGQPHVARSAIACRAAMRVLPLALLSPSLGLEEAEYDKSVLLGALRATFISWAANFYVDERENYDAILKAAPAAAVGSDKNRGRMAALSAAAAAATVAADSSVVATPENAAYMKAGSIALAARACDYAARAGEASDVWVSVSADATWTMLPNRAPLIQKPLWLIDVKGRPSFVVNFPMWAREPFDAFDRSDWVRIGPWGVWVAWYREILNDVGIQNNSRVFGKRGDIEIATKADEFWTRTPDLVTADIADIASSMGNFKIRKRDDVKIPIAGDLPRVDELDRVSAVEPQTDEPTRDDQLSRRPFAQAIVERLDGIFEKGASDSGFAAHIHAPWGAGKTSVLLIMQELMADKLRKSRGRPAPRWIVVDFNAWEHERRNPPWWPLVEKMKFQCFKGLFGTPIGRFDFCWAYLKKFSRGDELAQRKEHEHAVLLQARWFWWKLKADVLPYLLATAVGLICFWILWDLRGSQNGTALDWPFKLFTVALTGFAAFLGASRVAVFGSDTAAKFYESLSQDPLRRITRLFAEIVEKTDRPVCVFIDDLDRCRADYVVDLLEGIQTSFRHKNVAYIVAADRNWLKASFEARYGTVFGGAVGNAGQPLGYLFLEKIFQVSTPIPGMGEAIRAAYWSKLLKPIVGTQLVGQASNGIPQLSSAEAKRDFDNDVEAKRADLRSQHGDQLTANTVASILTESTTAAERAAILLELNASPAAEKEARHLLEQFTDLLPENPRVMKRMINAFAMRQAIGLLEGSRISSAMLARWTILEQRYPALADVLIANPEWTQQITEKIEDTNRERLPPALIPFANSDVIRAIIGEATEDRLDSKRVKEITRGSAS